MSMEEQMQAVDPLATENLTKPAIEMIPIAVHDNDNGNDDNDEDETDEMLNLKELARIKDRQRRLKRQRFSGISTYVRSRKLKRKHKMANAAASTDSNKKCINPMSIDAINVTIPKIELPYKKYRNAMLEIISQNEILENRTRVHRRTLEPFDYKRITTKAPRSASPKKIQRSSPNIIANDQINNDARRPAPATIKQARMSSSGIDSDDHQMSQTCGSRNKRRINYSEELVDEAFMYEQLLQDKQHRNQKHKNQQQKRKQSLTKSLDSKSLDGVLDAAVNSAAADAASGHLDSRLKLLEQRNEISISRNGISITPMRSNLMTKVNPSENHEMPVQIKTEPIFNITSSVSVHIKSHRPEQPAQNLQISNITSLHGKSAMPLKKRSKISCDYCQQKCPDEKHLAKHQLEHMKIVAYKIDSSRVLHPKLRRVSSDKKQTKPNQTKETNRMRVFVSIIN